MPFLLFAGHCHYPQGGVSDLQGTFASEQEAIDAFGAYDGGSYIDHWGQIVDPVTMKVIVELRQESTRTSLSDRGPVKIKRVR